MLHDRIMVEIEPDKKTTAGGLVLPDTSTPMRASGGFVFGKILAAGPGAKDFSYEGGRKPMDVKVGDRICYHQGAGNAVQVEGKIYMLLGNDNVQMVVPEDLDCNQIVFVSQELAR